MKQQALLRQTTNARRLSIAPPEKWRFQLRRVCTALNPYPPYPNACACVILTLRAILPPKVLAKSRALSSHAAAGRNASCCSRRGSGGPANDRTSVACCERVGPRFRKGRDLEPYRLSLAGNATFRE